MRVPLSWLNDFAPFGDDAVALAPVLDELGLVVEAVDRVGEGLGAVVVAEVLDIAAIEGADKIRKVMVSTGGALLQIVCGAWNFEVGDLVPLAPVGAVLPGDFAIGRRKMRGVASEGMLCSGRELRVSDDQAGLLVLGRAAAGGPAPGTPIGDALGIVPDAVFDLAVEANRPDAWSVRGVARDLAARLRLPFEAAGDASLGAPVAAGPVVTEAAAVEVDDLDLCPRFTARVLDGVVVGPSPAWMARRLLLAGMRPINLIVDVSNYVMLETGQPTHPYDLDLVPRATLRRRAARPGESVVTLDGVERRLGERSVGPTDDRRDCLICDGDDKPIGVAGVMGGASSEISDVTTRVLLEAAYFAPMAVARTSKRLNLMSEASKRFERGCDPWGIDGATERFCALVAAGATDGGPRVFEGAVDVRGDVPAPRRLSVHVARVNAILASDLDADAVCGYLTPLGFGCERDGDGALQVTAPTFRPDTEREIDVIEEVARHFGYANLPRRQPRPPQVGGLTPYQRERRLARSVLTGIGADEAWTPSLLPPDGHGRAGLEGASTVVANPLSPEESVLRRSMLPGLLQAVAFNADRRQGDARLFEIGAVFPTPDAARIEAALRHERPDATVVDERELLAVVLAGPADDARTAARVWRMFAEAMGLAGLRLRPNDPPPGGLHPTRTAAVLDGSGADYGVVGEVDPAVLDAFKLDGERRRIGWIEVDLRRLLAMAPRRNETARLISRFPSSDIDLAFAVDDAVAVDEVEATLRSAAGELLESISLFDVYRGEGVTAGERSLAFRLRFCALDRTLTDAEVGELRQACIAAAERAHGAKLRA